MSATILLADWACALVEQSLCLNLGSFCNKDNGQASFPHVDLSAEELSENELLSEGGQLMDMLCMRILHDSALRQGKGVLPYFLESYARAVDLTSKSQPLAVMTAMRASQATDKDVSIAASNIRKAIVTYSTLSVLEADTFGGVSDAVHARPWNPPLNAPASTTTTSTGGGGVMLSEAHAALYDAMIAPPGSTAALHPSYVPFVIEHLRAQPDSRSVLAAFFLPLLQALAATASHPLPVLDGPLEQQGGGASSSIDSPYRAPHRAARGERSRWARDVLYTACGRPAPPHTPAPGTRGMLDAPSAPGPSLLYPQGIRPTGPTGPMSRGGRGGGPAWAWEPALRWLAELARYPELAALMTGGGDSCSSSALWSAPGLLSLPVPPGDLMEGGTLLGRLFGLGPCPKDFCVPASSTASAASEPAGHVDLLQASVYWSTGVAPSAGGGEGGEGDAQVKGAAYVLQQLESHSSDPVISTCTLVPPSAAWSKENVEAEVRAIRGKLAQGMATHQALCAKLVQELVSRGKDCREAVLCWFGAFLRSCAPRAKTAYTSLSEYGPPTASSHAAATALACLVHLCSPFLEPTDPKCSRIDPRYVSDYAPNGNGGYSSSSASSLPSPPAQAAAAAVGRYDSSADDRMARLPENAGSGNSTAGDSVQGARWLDPRNLARQQQFLEKHRALMKQALAAAGGAGHSADGEEAQRSSSSAAGPYTSLVGPEPRPATPLPPPHFISEVFWLAVRAAHTGYIPCLTRQGQAGEKIKHAGEVIRAGVEALRALAVGPSFGLDSAGILSRRAQDTWGQVQEQLASLRAYVTAQALGGAVLDDARQVEGLLRLHRLLAVVLLRTADPSSARLVPGMCGPQEHVLAITAGGSAEAGLVDARMAASPAVKAEPSLPSLPDTPTTPVLSPGPGLGPGPGTPSRTPGRTAGGGAPTLIPLPAPALPLGVPHAIWCGLPENLAVDVCSVLSWLLRHRSHAHSLLLSPGSPLTAAVWHDFLTFAAVFLGSPLYVPNPYTRMQLMRVVSVFVPHRDMPWRVPEPPGGLLATGSVSLRASPPPIHTLMMANSLALAHLIPAIVSFFVDLGSSGIHSGAVDKWGPRADAMDALGYLWATYPAYRIKWIQWAHTPANSKLWLEFANAVAVDMDDFLSTAVQQLEIVRSIQDKERDAAAWASLSEEERADQVQQMEGAQRYASGMLHYSTSSVHFLSLVTQGMSHVWLSPKLRSKLTSSLGLTLAYLTDPVKRKKLDIRGKKQEVGFKPRELLLELVTVYANLAAAGPRAGAEPLDEEGNTTPDGEDTSIDILATCIIRDERSYKLDNFREAVSVLSRPVMLAPAKAEGVAGGAAGSAGAGTLQPADPSTLTQIDRLSLLLPRLQAASAKSAAAEADLGELPDELCDPMMFCLLEEPVLLPSSAQVVDKSAIVGHLLNEQRDPYNRAFLTEDMLLPLPAVKAAVAAWVRARKAGRDGEEEAKAVAQAKEEAVTAHKEKEKGKAGAAASAAAPASASVPAPVAAVVPAEPEAARVASPPVPPSATPAPAPAEPVEVPAAEVDEDEEALIAAALALSLSEQGAGVPDGDASAERAQGMRRPVREAQEQEGHGAAAAEDVDVASAIAASLERQAGWGWGPA